MGAEYLVEGLSGGCWPFSWSRASWSGWNPTGRSGHFPSPSSWVPGPRPFSGYLAVTAGGAEPQPARALGHRPPRPLRRSAPVVDGAVRGLRAPHRHEHVGATVALGDNGRCYATLSYSDPSNPDYGEPRRAPKNKACLRQATRQEWPARSSRNDAAGPLQRRSDPRSAALDSLVVLGLWLEVAGNPGPHGPTWSAGSHRRNRTSHRGSLPRRHRHRTGDRHPWPRCVPAGGPGELCSRSFVSSVGVCPWSARWRSWPSASSRVLHHLLKLSAASVRDGPDPRDRANDRSVGIGRRARRPHRDPTVTADGWHARPPA